MKDFTYVLHDKTSSIEDGLEVSIVVEFNREWSAFLDDHFTRGHVFGSDGYRIVILFDDIVPVENDF